MSQTEQNKHAASFFTLLALRWKQLLSHQFAAALVLWMCDVVDEYSYYLLAVPVFILLTLFRESRPFVGCT